MAKVNISIELEDAHYRSLVFEAKRKGVPVESLVEQMTQRLVRKLEEAERSGTDHPISTS
jgi:hypothetical protein